MFRSSGLAKAAALSPSVTLQSQQQRVADRVASGDDLLVYHQIGAGKGGSGIAAAEAVGEPYAFVSPASLRINTRKELDRFSDQTIPADVLSYEQVVRGKGPRGPFGTLIVDESQAIKNPDSARSRAVAELASRAKRKVLLTGTPIVNSPSDLAAPISLLTSHKMDPAEFDRRFVGRERVPRGLLATLRGVKPGYRSAPKNVKDLERILRGHVDYHAPDRPLVREIDERIEAALGPDQRNLHRWMWGKLPWTTRWKLTRDYPLTPEEVGNLSGFLTGPRQVGLSTLPFMGKSDPIKAFDKSPKLRRAVEELEKEFKANPEGKALVFSNFIDAGLNPYSAALERRGIPHGVFKGGLTDEARKRLIEDYNSGKLRALLLGPAGSEGLSTRRTSLIQQLDPHWNETRGKQNKGRGIRFDSHLDLDPEDRQVRVQRFISRTPPTLKERILGGRQPSADEVLERMAAEKERLNEQFREILRRVGSEKRGSLLGGLIVKAADCNLDGLPYAPGSSTDEHGAPCPDGECCPSCRARLEREPRDGTCNRCGEEWPLLEKESRERPSKRTIRVGGLEIKVEYRKGDVRKGTSKDGEPWSRTMRDGYGRIVGTKGADGEAIDCYLGPEVHDAVDVFVVNQVDPATGKFDEAKCMLGYGSETVARKAYLRNYPDDWGGLGSIISFSHSQFKGWLRDGNTRLEAQEPGQETGAARAKAAARVSGLASDEGPLSQSAQQEVPLLRFEGNNGLRFLAGELRGLLLGHGSPPRGNLVGAERQRPGVLPSQLPLGYEEAAGSKQAKQCPPHSRGRDSHVGGMGGAYGNPIQDSPQPGDGLWNGSLQGVNDAGPADESLLPAHAMTKAAAVNPVLRDLLHAKSESDRRNYKGKHQVMRRLLAERPDEFVVDDPRGWFVGLVHTPTTFKMHLPRNLIPEGIGPALLAGIGGDANETTLRPDWANLRSTHGVEVRVPGDMPVAGQKKAKSGPLLDLPLRVRRGGLSSRVPSVKQDDPIMWMPPAAAVVGSKCSARRCASGEEVEGIQGLERDAQTMPEPTGSGLSEIRSERDYDKRGLGPLREFLSGHGSMPPGALVGSDLQRQRILQGKLPLGYRKRAGDQQKHDAVSRLERGTAVLEGVGRPFWAETADVVRKTAGRVGGRGSTDDSRGTTKEAKRCGGRSFTRKQRVAIYLKNKRKGESERASKEIFKAPLKKSGGLSGLHTLLRMGDV